MAVITLTQSNLKGIGWNALCLGGYALPCLLGAHFINKIMVKTDDRTFKIGREKHGLNLIKTLAVTIATVASVYFMGKIPLVKASGRGAIEWTIICCGVTSLLSLFVKSDMKEWAHLASALTVMGAFLGWTSHHSELGMQKYTSAAWYVFTALAGVVADGR